jgi:Co/Zn/Cd efflux system component
MQPVTPECKRASRGAVRFSILASASLVTLQFTIGWFSGSHAIVADGTHTVVDLLIDALLFASFYLRTTQLRATPRATASWAPATLCTVLSAGAGAFFLAEGIGVPVQAATVSIAPGATAQSLVLLAALPLS